MKGELLKKTWAGLCVVANAQGKITFRAFALGQGFKLWPLPQKGRPQNGHFGPVSAQGSGPDAPEAVIDGRFK